MCLFLDPPWNLPDSLISNEFMRSLTYVSYLHTSHDFYLYLKISLWHKITEIIEYKSYWQVFSNSPSHPPFWKSFYRKFLKMESHFYSVLLVIMCTSIVTWIATESWAFSYELFFKNSCGYSKVLSYSKLKSTCNF